MRKRESVKRELEREKESVVFCYPKIEVKNNPIEITTEAIEA